MNSLQYSKSVQVYHGSFVGSSGCQSWCGSPCRLTSGSWSSGACARRMSAAPMAPARGSCPLQSASLSHCINNITINKQGNISDNDEATRIFYKILKLNSDLNKLWHVSISKTCCQITLSQKDIDGVKISHLS